MNNIPMAWRYRNGPPKSYVILMNQDQSIHHIMMHEMISIAEEALKTEMQKILQWEEYPYVSDELRVTKTAEYHFLRTTTPYRLIISHPEIMMPYLKQHYPKAHHYLTAT
ncbi:MAG: hypothetical protein WC525_09090 [Candidatus Thermoplasmatota archaeon]